MSDVSVLDVMLHGESIGTITQLPDDRNLFAFNTATIANEHRATLSLSFIDRLGALITDFKPRRTRLMPFFSNLLPESTLRLYLAQRADVNPAREFFLLWALGQDLPGAVTVAPAKGHAWPPAALEDSDAIASDRSQPALRFSLAGVQLKFSAVAQARGGLTIPVTGVGGSWIVKLPSQTFAGVPENEFSMMTLAASIGIDTPAVQLVDLNDIQGLPSGLDSYTGQALAIERFDRGPDGSAIHIEDFAQIFGVYPEAKYEKASYRNIASVIAAESNQADIAQFIRRLTFNTLIGNGDMHLKNWSMIYRDPRRPTLAPAYDLVSTVPYIGDEKAALNVSRSKRFDEFTIDELSHLAAKAQLPEKLVLDTAVETVALFHQHWQAEKQHLPLTKRVIDAIDQHLPTIPLR